MKKLNQKYVKELLLLLRQNGVKSFEDSNLGLKIELGDRASFIEPIITPDPTPDIGQILDQSKSADPDDIMFWSAKG